MMNERILGVCSCCGGEVVVPAMWSGIHAPKPVCRSCGAQATNNALPVIPTRKVLPSSPFVRTQTIGEMVRTEQAEPQPSLSYTINRGFPRGSL